VTLLPFSQYAWRQRAGHARHAHRAGRAAGLPDPDDDRRLLSAIGIAGMDRMIQANVIAMSGRAVEAAGDVDVLLLDKTGTITLGNRQAALPSLRRASPSASSPTRAARLARRRDARGRSIVVLAKEKFGCAARGHRPRRRSSRSPRRRA
jgi:K+-transporting ATPase ATPase B chain